MSHALENTIEKSIDIYVPLRTVFNQWTKFEDYPKFMEGVREVKRFDGNRLHWRCDRRTGDGMGFGDHRADPRYPDHLEELQ